MNDKVIEDYETSQHKLVLSRLDNIRGLIGNDEYSKLANGIKADRTRAIDQVELRYWKWALTKHPSDKNASKALNEMDDLDGDGLGMAIYRYNTDGIDSSVLAEDNIDDFISDDHDDVQSAKDDHNTDDLKDAKSTLQDDLSTKRFIDNHPDTYYYGGTADPVSSDTVLDFINQELG